MSIQGEGGSWEIRKLGGLEDLKTRSLATVIQCFKFRV